MKSFFILLFTIILLPSTAISTDTDLFLSPQKRRADDHVDIIPSNSKLIRKVPIIVSISYDIEEESFNLCNERIYGATTRYSSKAKGNLFFGPGFQFFSIETGSNYTGPDPDQEVAKGDVHGYYYDKVIAHLIETSKGKYECERGRRRNFSQEGFNKNSLPPQSSGILPSEEKMYNGNPFFALLIRYPHPRENNTFDDQIDYPPFLRPDDFPQNANIYFESPGLESPSRLSSVSGRFPSIGAGGIHSNSKLEFTMTPSMLENALRKSSFHTIVSWSDSGVEEVSGIRIITRRNILDLNIDFGNHRSNYIYY